MSTTIDLIKQLRSVGLSQSEISRRTGIPQPRLSKWENGSIPIGADDALKLKALVDGLTVQHKTGDAAAGDHTTPTPDRSTTDASHCSHYCRNGIWI